MKPFDIETDDMMLRARLRGYWTREIAVAYGGELKRHAFHLQHRPHPMWLIDVSDFAVQAGEVVDILGPSLIAALGVSDRPPAVALVGASMLGSMQAKRLTAVEHGRFASVEAAEAWLSERSPAP